MAKRLSMDDVSEAINDLDMAGGEISYRVSDLYAFLEGRNLNHRQRNRIAAAAKRACELMNKLGEIREALGLEERPEPYKFIPPGGQAK